MRHMHLALSLAIAGVLALTGATPATAQISNGTFDNGLTDWTATTTGGGDVSVSSTNGNPGPGIWLWNGFDHAGSATLTQTFNCGGNGDGVCFLSLEYATDVTGGTNMAVTVKLDNVVVYSANHNGTVQTFMPVLFSAPCGPHTIEISAASTNTSLFSHWMMIVDNVTASCVPPVATDGSTWSSLKATYR